MVKELIENVMNAYLPLNSKVGINVTLWLWFYILAINVTLTLHNRMHQLLVIDLIKIEWKIEADHLQKLLVCSVHFSQVLKSRHFTLHYSCHTLFSSGIDADVHIYCDGWVHVSCSGKVPPNSRCILFWGFQLMKVKL